MRLKELSAGEVRWIYKHHLTRDFPAAERKPLRVIQALRKRGDYQCYAMDKDGTVIAYAFFCRQGSWCLLDYYAVCDPFRGRGYGTKALEGLRMLFSGLGVLAEVEDPRGADTPQEEETRLRRIAFYERLGFRMTDIRVRLFAVDYRVMALEPEELHPMDSELHDVLGGIYQKMMGAHTEQFLKMTLGETG